MIKNFLLPFIFLLFLFLLNFTFADDKNLFQTKNENKPNNYSKSPVEVALCEGSASAFFVSDNINIQENIKPSSIIRGINEQQCIEFCKNNRDQNGRTLLCSLLIYRSEVQECRLYRHTTFPDGELFRQSLEGYRLIEKFCLSEDVSMECANKQFIRVDNYILRGYAQSTTTVPTLAECVSECMKEKEFNCLSAMYFYEEGECITNTESAITAPDDFQPPEEDDQKVVFFHNACSKGNDHQLELAQSQDSAITSTSALIQQDETTTKDLIITSSSSPSSPTTFPSSSSSPILSTTTTSLPLSSTEENKNNLFIQENNKNEEQNNILIPQINSVKTTKISEEESDKQQKEEEENKLNNQNSENKNKLINSSSVFILPEEENNNQKQQNQQILIPKVYLPQKEENNNLEQNDNNLIIQQQQQPLLQQRQYGAKNIERASDGSFQEKIQINSSDDLLPISKSNNLIKPTNLNRKGPESTKRLHLKLIKDQHPKPDLNKIIFSPHSSTTTTITNTLPPKIHKLIPKNNIHQQSLPLIYSSPSSTPPPPSSPPPSPSTTPSTTINVQNHPEFIPLELSEPLTEHSAEERFEGSEGYFSLWGPWTPCNIPGERRIRRRKCLDLRKCRGSLTQVDYCPTNIDEEQKINNEKQINELSLPSPPPPPPSINENFNNKNNNEEEPKPPGITPPPSHEMIENIEKQKELILNKHQKQFGIKNENNSEIWSAWNGTCQHFASSQPCKDGQVIGFESRECIAKDPLFCKGPFFRYCTLPC
uniref:Apple domain-containing protein n=1 Tax=Meloidogyne incognita TaxID=6306 RepID=A0A914M1V5_MELIC